MRKYRRQLWERIRNWVQLFSEGVKGSPIKSTSRIFDTTLGQFSLKRGIEFLTPRQLFKKCPNST